MAAPDFLTAVGKAMKRFEHRQSRRLQRAKPSCTIWTERALTIPDHVPDGSAGPRCSDASFRDVKLLELACTRAYKTGAATTPPQIPSGCTGPAGPPNAERGRGE